MRRENAVDSNHRDVIIIQTENMGRMTGLGKDKVMMQEINPTENMIRSGE